MIVMLKRLRLNAYSLAKENKSLVKCGIIFIWWSYLATAASKISSVSNGIIRDVALQKPGDVLSLMLCTARQWLHCRTNDVIANV